MPAFAYLVWKAHLVSKLFDSSPVMAAVPVCKCPCVAEQQLPALAR